jgi:hypothetical protein
MPARFYGANFEGSLSAIEAQFSQRADFRSASFRSSVEMRSAHFRAEADFSSVKFAPEKGYRAEAHFDSCMFDNTASFFGADFGESEARVEASFQSATFSQEANFGSVTFSDDARFTSTTFKGPIDFRDAVFLASGDFNSATITSYLRFRGRADKPAFRGVNRSLAEEQEAVRAADDCPQVSSLSFEDANIEHPERVSFHTVVMRPHWFLNVDSRKFDFINVQWAGVTEERPEADLLSIATRHLAVNAEENHRYEEASRFRYLSMEASLARLGRFHRILRLDWWYKLASGYGERAGRAFVVLVAVWLIFAIFYTNVRFVRPNAYPTTATSTPPSLARGKVMHVPDAAAYSFGVMALQKPEPKPASLVGQALVTLQSILGPVQAALLALAVRRKFMR